MILTMKNPTNCPSKRDEYVIAKEMIYDEKGE